MTLILSLLYSHVLEGIITSVTSLFFLNSSCVFRRHCSVPLYFDGLILWIGLLLYSTFILVSTYQTGEISTRLGCLYLHSSVVAESWAFRPRLKSWLLSLLTWTFRCVFQCLHLWNGWAGLTLSLGCWRAGSSYPVCLQVSPETDAAAVRIRVQCGSCAGLSETPQDLCRTDCFYTVSKAMRCEKLQGHRQPASFTYFLKLKLFYLIPVWVVKIGIMFNR